MNILYIPGLSDNSKSSPHSILEGLDYECVNYKLLKSEEDFDKQVKYAYKSITKKLKDKNLIGGENVIIAKSFGAVLLYEYCNNEKLPNDTKIILISPIIDKIQSNAFDNYKTIIIQGKLDKYAKLENKYLPMSERIYIPELNHGLKYKDGKSGIKKSTNIIKEYIAS